jgi:pyruvate dehydrogenase E2 component (dihydrolipoamide acetyltransferase)
VKDEGIDPASLAGISGTGYQGGVTAKDIKASPLARKVAAVSGVDLAAVAGSGPGGKVMKADVLSRAVPSAPQDGEKKVLSVTPYKGIRKIIGDKLAQSKFTAPHLYFTERVDVTNLTAFRQQLNETAEVKIAVSDLLTLAAAKALKKYPAVNASLINGEIISYKSINVGTAVAGNNGLIVPVVKDVQEKSLTDVARESRDLVARAKEGRLESHEYSGGTFTISNLGMFGVENFTAIINGTEAAILSVSSVRKKAVVVTGENGEDSVVIRPMMNIQLSVDHRLIDGLLAVQFLGYIRRLLENPMLILV